MAALYATYLSADAMHAPLERFCFSFGLVGLFKEFTLPVLSYFEGSGFTRVVREPFGADMDIEDMWLPYFCVTTNMSSCTREVHRSGRLWWHLRASMSVLGFVPPMIDELTGNGMVPCKG